MKRFSCLSALVGVLTVCGGVSRSFAQAAPDAKPVLAASSARLADQEDLGPTKLRGLIKAFSGKWLLSVKFEPMAGIPSGLAGTGEESWRQGPGSYTLVEEEHIPTPGGQGYLLGIFWWDSKLKSLQGMECNNQAPSTCDLKGALTDITVTWDEKILTIDGSRRMTARRLFGTRLVEHYPGFIYPDG